MRLLQKEQSEVFFSVTKLFQNKDVNLRRMVRLRAGAAAGPAHPRCTATCRQALLRGLGRGILILLWSAVRSMDRCIPAKAKGREEA